MPKFKRTIEMSILGVESRREVQAIAVQWTGDTDDTEELENVLGDQEIVVKTSNPPYLSVHAEFHGREFGHRLVSIGQWVLRVVSIGDPNYPPSGVPNVWDDKLFRECWIPMSVD